MILRSWIAAGLLSLGVGGAWGQGVPNQGIGVPNAQSIAPYLASGATIYVKGSIGVDTTTPGSTLAAAVNCNVGSIIYPCLDVGGVIILNASQQVVDVVGGFASVALFQAAGLGSPGYAWTLNNNNTLLLLNTENSFVSENTLLVNFGPAWDYFVNLASNGNAPLMNNGIGFGLNYLGSGEVDVIGSATSTTIFSFLNYAGGTPVRLMDLTTTAEFLRYDLYTSGNINAGLLASANNRLNVAGSASLAVSGFIGFVGNVAVTASNYNLFGDTNNTFVNGPVVTQLRVAGTEVLGVAAGGTTLIGTLTAATLSSTGTATGALCVTSAGLVFTDSSLTICGLTSTAGGKDNIKLLPSVDRLAMLEPVTFNRKPYEVESPYNDPNHTREQVGLIADYWFDDTGIRHSGVCEIDPALCVYEGDGVTPRGYRPEAIVSLLIAGYKKQQEEIDALRARH